jgi:hypothetical protein
MKINELNVTSNYFDLVDETSAHIELDGCVRLVHIENTEFKTIEDLKLAIENLIIK